jgi:protein phosphatase
VWAAELLVMQAFGMNRLMDEGTVGREDESHFKSSHPPFRPVALSPVRRSRRIHLDKSGAHTPPGSAKAQELLRSQYASSAGRVALPAVVSSLCSAAERLTGNAQSQAAALQSDFSQRHANIDRFVSAYREYCWPVASVKDLKLAPLHLLAPEGRVHIHQNHAWHIESLAMICQQDLEVLLATETRQIDLNESAEEQAGITLWEEMTAQGG